ncbi:MAG TPA: ABC transporter ATP-binding protein, partial [Tepidisphaeraceae bacterium]|nr:ABC transporter ATP-binding protein [Tepidisphaeraceae bacterium]
NRQLVLWMFRFLRPVYAYAAIACIWVTLAVGAEVLTTQKTGDAVNHIKDLAVHPSGAGTIWHWLQSIDPQVAAMRHVLKELTLIICALVILQYLKQVANAKMSMNLVYYLREGVYDKLQRVGFGFHDTISTGQLINRALSDLQNVRMFVQTAVLTTLDMVLIVGGYIILISTISKWFALLSVIPLPIWLMYMRRFGRRVQPVGRAVMEAQDRNISIITENISGVHVIKAFAMENQEIAKYGRSCDDYLDRQLGRIRLFANFQPVVRAIATGSSLSLFLIGGIMLLRGWIQPGDLLILSGAMGQILGRFQQIAVINEQYQNAVVSSRRLYEVLMAAPTIPEAVGAKPLPPGNGEVVFENVTFGYDPSKPVLQNVSFRVPAGSVVALVGPTGSGKSTLVSLISRFYDPQEGRVLVDGLDLRQATLASIRSQIAYVFQETYLFSDTVAANIAYGRPRMLDGRGRPLSGRGEIEAAARLAQAHEFIEALPRGYDTVLSERGSSLSGGQRQRLAIARAILSDPRVLVLDDATAAVDPETEDLIRRAMRHVLSCRTTFLIAHRISTVRRADLVLVVENGRITQRGTHDELMTCDGHYRQIAAAQLYGDESLISGEVQRVDPIRSQEIGALEPQLRVEEN